MIKGKIFKLLRAIMPSGLRRKYTNRRAERFKRQMRGKSTKEIFSEIYRRNIWGRSRDGTPFFSGSGSHDPEVVNGYVEAVNLFISKLDKIPDVVDLGCGDFAVGRLIRPYCGAYVACDIVEDLIEHNRKVHSDISVDFKCVDVAKDDLPLGDIVFVRQVFQHLSNHEIVKALEKISRAYSYLILTEHVPLREGFVPNEDKPSGADIRTAMGSGIVLSEAPFNFDHIESQVIFEIEEENSLIQTVLYKIK